MACGSGIWLILDGPFFNYQEARWAGRSERGEPHLMRWHNARAGIVRFLRIELLKLRAHPYRGFREGGFQSRSCCARPSSV